MNNIAACTKHSREAVTFLRYISLTSQFLSRSCLYPLPVVSSQATKSRIDILVVISCNFARRCSTPWFMLSMVPIDDSFPEWTLRGFRVLQDCQFHFHETSQQNDKHTFIDVCLLLYAILGGSKLFSSFIQRHFLSTESARPAVLFPFPSHA